MPGGGGGAGGVGCGTGGGVGCGTGGGGGSAGRAGTSGGGFRDIFSNIFGGRGGTAEAGFSTGPQPGTDLEYQVSVGFWQAIRGAEMRITVSHQDVCTNCHGSGYLETSTPCPECGGKGQVTQTSGRMKFNVPCPRCGGTGHDRTVCPVCKGDGVVTRNEPLTIRIKPGTRDGQRIRLAGKGNAGFHGGPPGDLYIIIRTGEHPLFRREADDIYVTVPVTAPEAALGARIEVPTIDGRAQLKVPPGTQSGQKLRLREKGVPSATKEGVRGDQIVDIKIVVPEARDLKVRELWQQLQKLNPDDPRAEMWKAI